ncbi:hypothetical protein BDP27DRAFT_1414215 [Rhodocollybia butyracea]|uniref:C2H2-type domain-containing protein n=1 Tax=Rhodocollybia butyracea TaxID=206335 RepID=A0A9P5Q8W3_9AGAR|nr:hypothetical protein BDP27DRAFT_1414215 [Rhodocollybia butyracea]
MSSTSSDGSSPGSEYSSYFPINYNSPSCPTLAQGSSLQSFDRGRSVVLRDTGGSTRSPTSPPYAPNWQRADPTLETLHSPLFNGSAMGLPANTSNTYMVSPIHSPHFSPNPCQTSRDFVLPQPLLGIDEGDGKLTVGNGVPPAQGKALGWRRNAEGRFECPEPHCGKSYTAKHNLEGHINRSHLGQPSSYVCDYCGLDFTGSRAHKRHMRNGNVCPTSPLAQRKGL